MSGPLEEGTGLITHCLPLLHALSLLGDASGVLQSSLGLGESWSCENHGVQVLRPGSGLILWQFLNS